MIIEDDKDILASVKSEGKNKVFITNAITKEYENFDFILPKASVPLDFDG